MKDKDDREFLIHSLERFRNDMLGQIDDVELALRELGHEEKGPPPGAFTTHYGSTYNSPELAHSAQPKVTILPTGEEARDEFGHRYGSQQAKLTQEQIDALLAGQQLAVEIMEGEYMLFLSAEDKQ